MIKKRLLITGGSSYLGQFLVPKATEQFEVYATYRTNPDNIPAGKPAILDLTSRSEVHRVVAKINPDAIIHAAAVNPGKGDEQRMMQVNAGGTRFVAEAAVSVGARLVHVSTDVIFDGKQPPYADDAPPSPLNGYGRSKAAAEAAVTDVAPQAAIVRTSLIYGLKRMDRGTEGFVRRLKSGEPLVLFNDVIRQPVWVDSLAEALLKLVNLNFSGTLNVAGQQPITREQFGRLMLAWWNIGTAGQLQSGRAAGISATIPLDVRLPVKKAENLLQMSLPGVEEVLAAHSSAKKQDDYVLAMQMPNLNEPKPKNAIPQKPSGKLK